MSDFGTGRRKHPQPATGVWAAEARLLRAQSSRGPEAARAACQAARVAARAEAARVAARAEAARVAARAEAARVAARAEVARAPPRRHYHGTGTAPRHHQSDTEAAPARHQGPTKAARHTQPAAAALLEALAHDVLEGALAVLEGYGLAAK
eukprot:scaffold100715_cov60-Phaeocystis_antarctica.AAC.3